MAQRHSFRFQPTPFPFTDLNPPPLLPPVVLQALHRLITFSSDIQLLTSHLAPHLHFAKPHHAFTKPMPPNLTRRRKPTARSTAWRLTSPSTPPYLAPQPSPLCSSQPPPIPHQPTSRTNQAFSAPPTPARSPHTQHLQVEALDLATLTRPLLLPTQHFNRSECTADTPQQPLCKVSRPDPELTNGPGIVQKASDNLLEHYPSSSPAVKNAANQSMVADSDDESCLSDRLAEPNTADGSDHSQSDLVLIPSEDPPLPVVTLDSEADSLSMATDLILSAPEVPSALSTLSDLIDPDILQPTTTIHLTDSTVPEDIITINHFNMPTSETPTTVSSSKKKKKKKKAKKNSSPVSESACIFSSEGGWITLDQDLMAQPIISEIDPIRPANTFPSDTTSIDSEPQISESQQVDLCKRLLLCHPGYILLQKDEQGILLGKDHNQNLYDQDAFCYSLDGTFIFQRKNGVISW